MSKGNKQCEIKTISIDLAKSSFKLYAQDSQGNAVMNKRFSRAKLKEFMVKQPACLVAMEACGSAHYWARLFDSYGHDMKLIAPQFVKPYVKSNKTDAADAEAIGEAVQHPHMRYVAAKTVSQQDNPGDSPDAESDSQPANRSGKSDSGFAARVWCGDSPRPPSRIKEFAHAPGGWREWVE